MFVAFFRPPLYDAALWAIVRRYRTATGALSANDSGGFSHNVFDYVMGLPQILWHEYNIQKVVQVAKGSPNIEYGFINEQVTVDSVN